MRSAATRPGERHIFTVEASAGGRRLDVFLANHLPDVSRARLQALIEAGQVTIVPASHRVRASSRVRPGEQIVVDVPPAAPSTLQPQSMPLSIVYEDDALLVIDKPAGLTVHPGAGQQTGTLVQAVLAHCPDLPGIGGRERPGVVHRLDKDTSGLIVLAKTEAALRSLQAQIQARTAHREYLALVRGRLGRSEGTIEGPIGRDPRRRTRMAIVASGRPAITHYHVVERFLEATLLEVRLQTGRTHQIRVHCASIGHPVVGDAVYGRRANPWGLRRQALHAFRLTFAHPVTGEAMTFHAPIPQDLEAALRILRQNAGDASQ